MAEIFFIPIVAFLVSFGAVPLFGEIIFRWWKSTATDEQRLKGYLTAEKMAKGLSKTQALSERDYKKLYQNGWGFSGLTCCSLCFSDQLPFWALFPAFCLLGFGVSFWALGRFGQHCYRLGHFE